MDITPDSYAFKLGYTRAIVQRKADDLRQITRDYRDGMTAEVQTKLLVLIQELESITAKSELAYNNHVEACKELARQKAEKAGQNV